MYFISSIMRLIVLMQSRPCLITGDANATIVLEDAIKLLSMWDVRHRDNRILESPVID